jgi:hypothetical protein
LQLANPSLLVAVVLYWTARVGLGFMQFCLLELMIHLPIVDLWHIFFVELFEYEEEH